MPPVSAASVRSTPLGPPAIEALAQALTDSGTPYGRSPDDPLAPGLVVCSSPLVAVGVRRELGRRPGGVAGIDVVTTERLIEELSRDALAEVGQHPAGSLEMQAAIRRVLATAPGRFGAVAEHRTTEERLLRLEDEIVGLPREDLRRLAAVEGLAGDAFRVLDQAGDHLGPSRVRSHVVQLAVEALEALPLGARGPIVVYLPEPTRPRDARLVHAFSRRADTTILVGVTGHDVVDRSHRDRLSGFGVTVGPGPAPDDVPRGRRLEVADPDDEVRAALRELVSWAAAGTPLSRMGLLYTAADPYASIIEDALADAELPFSSPGHRPLSSSLAGRSLLRLLSLVTSGLERSAVITLVSSAPVRISDGSIAPATTWDRLSRQAGVVDGDDWIPRVTRMAAHLEEADQPPAESLVAFIEDLHNRLHPGLADQPRSWEEWASWCLDLLNHLLTPNGASGWPDTEVVAFERVEGLLKRLRTLDSFDAAPTFGAFAATVVGELESSTVPGRPAGKGLMVAPVSSASGLNFERVAVVGLNEGLFPGSGREDSLLPDQVRAAAGAWLLAKAQRPAVDTRALTVVVASAHHQPLLTTARGDLRSRRSKVWPRQLDHLVGETAVIESHHRGLVDHGRPVTHEDVGLRSLVRHVDNGDPVFTHDLAVSDETLAAGLARHLDRAKPALTRHSGLVDPGLVDPTARPLSPTALEDYASCPRRYLFGRVLRLADPETPEQIEEISPRARGTLVHRILERFVGQAIEEGLVPKPDEAWSPEMVDRLLDLADEEVAEVAALGVTGGQVQTEILRRQIRNEALRFIEQDNDIRATKGSTPVAVEHEFGFDDDQPLMVQLKADEVRLRGLVDRVDLTDDGGLLVIDYKGGSATPYSDIAKDPLKGGTRLQLPLYARALAQEFDRSGPRQALYWLTKKAELKLMPLEPDVEDELDELVGAALVGIKSGLFPAVPGDTVGWPRLTFSNCKFCDFDRICPTDRQKEWDDLVDDEALNPLASLLGREEDE